MEGFFFDPIWCFASPSLAVSRRFRLSVCWLAIRFLWLPSGSHEVLFRRSKVTLGAGSGRLFWRVSSSILGGGVFRFPESCRFEAFPAVRLLAFGRFLWLPSGSQQGDLIGVRR